MDAKINLPHILFLTMWSLITASGKSVAKLSVRAIDLFSLNMLLQIEFFVQEFDFQQLYFLVLLFPLFALLHVRNTNNLSRVNVKPQFSFHHQDVENMRPQKPTCPNSNSVRARTCLKPARTDVASSSLNIKRNVSIRRLCLLCSIIVVGSFLSFIVMCV